MRRQKVDLEGASRTAEQARSKGTRGRVMHRVSEQRVFQGPGRMVLADLVMLAEAEDDGTIELEVSDTKRLVIRLESAD